MLKTTNTFVPCMAYLMLSLFWHWINSVQVFFDNNFYEWVDIVHFILSKCLEALEFFVCNLVHQVYKHIFFAFKESCNNSTIPESYKIKTKMPWIEYNFCNISSENMVFQQSTLDKSSDFFSLYVVFSFLRKFSQHL